MKHEMISKEVKCIGDCLLMAETALQNGKIDHVEMMLIDAMKSIETVKELDKNATVVLISKTNF